MRYTRRDFLATAASVPLVSLASAPAFARGIGNSAASNAARFIRPNVATEQGQRMLASYARGIQAMLDLPASSPLNWFRNAFVHLMDCPHGNWWFYVWHRGYVGYFEQAIRRLSGDAQFAMPYWDWTSQPYVPEQLFKGVLSPTDGAHAPYTGNLARFTRFLRPELVRYWNSLDAPRRRQLALRGYSTFDDLWNDVTGYNAKAQTGISGNAGYAITCGARYLSADNPRFDAKTAGTVSMAAIEAGLSPLDFYNAEVSRSFTSSRTASHVQSPDGNTQFSALEGGAHNKVHNCIGGVGAIDPGPYGNMTNFLSPLDPIFYLHHANMDRLWDIWTRRQIAQGRDPLPTLPADRRAFLQDPFLFFVDGNGRFVGDRTAADFVSTDVFGYRYDAVGAASAVPDMQAAAAPATSALPRRIRGQARDGAVVLRLPKASLQAHLAASQAQTLMAEVTLQRPHGLNNTREFDVLVNAPPEVTEVAADSPYYAGTVSFFGPTMSGMDHAHGATFAVPLPQRLGALTSAAASAGAEATLTIRLVASSGQARQAIALLDAAILLTR